MAWNTILDIQYKCKECNRYRVFNPHDISRKPLVQNLLSILQQFFEKQLKELMQKSQKGNWASKKRFYSVVYFMCILSVCGV
jgi:hypothetical protein